MNRRNRCYSFLVAALCAAGAAVPAAAQPRDPLIASMAKDGVAKIALAAQPPYAYVAPDGTPKGYVIDVVNLVTKNLGIARLEPTVTSWDAMIPGLEAKQFDFIPAGLSISAARCQVVLFTSPIQVGQDAMYVKPGDEVKVTGYAYFTRTPGAMLAVLTGGLQEAYAVNKVGLPRSQLVGVPDAQAGIAAVLGGRAAAFAIGQFSVPEPEKKGVKRVVDPSSPVAGIGIVFRKQDVGARDAFDKQLELLRGNGAMKKLYADTYGFTNWDLLAKTTKTTDIASTCQ
jgi:polar amino acid transport system substrate-binding protein